MTKYYIHFIVILTILVITSCVGPSIQGSGTIVSEARTVSGFHSITLDGTGNILIRQDTTQSLLIETDDNIIDLLETNVSDSTVEIGFGTHRFVHPTKLNIYISMTAVKNITLNGSGNISGTDTIHTGKLTLEINGSGNITLCVAATSVSAEIAGSGNHTLSGTSGKTSFEIDGSGDIKAPDLPSKTARVVISGSGDCKVAVSDSLNVKISGSGDVYYKGTPHIEKSITGSGSVKAL